jgi:FG-GAP repeat protein
VLPHAGRLAPTVLLLALTIGAGTPARSASPNDSNTTSRSLIPALHKAKLTASDASSGDLFGVSVAVSGSTAVVGAPGDNASAGSAYVFLRSGGTWAQQAQLVAADGAAGDEFGHSVSVSGNTAVVGAWKGDTPAGSDAGAAYVFVRSGTVWTQQAKLTASDGFLSNFFGSAVAVNGGATLVGAYRANSFPNFGKAYVFVRSGNVWTEQAKLIASDGGGEFGISVALNGTTAVIGADTGFINPGDNAGAAYVFVRSGNTWSEQAKLTASDGASGDAFGYAVGLNGDTAAVGALEASPPAGSEAGSAYVFGRVGTVWTEQAKITPSDAAARDFFGVSVAVSGATVVVGAYQDDNSKGVDAGSSYLFVKSGNIWVQQVKITASDGLPGDYFGISVAMIPGTDLVGASKGDAPGVIDAGSASAIWS